MIGCLGGIGIPMGIMEMMGIYSQVEEMEYHMDLPLLKVKISWRFVGEDFGVDDVIGCYWNRAERTIGYTKNGIHLGVAFLDVIETVLYPTVGFRTKNEEVCSTRSLVCGKIGVVCRFGRILDWVNLLLIWMR